MNHRYVTLLAALWLAGCGGGGGGDGGQPAPNQPAPPAPNPPANPSLAVSGAVQKGPFLVGSTVLINRLDSLGRSTASTIVSQVEDSIGSFDFVSTDPGPVQIVASGYYFSELTGQISTGTLTLRALYQITGQPSQTVYVNMLTHLINDRVLALLSGGTATLSSAIAQAELEVLAAFQPALPVTGVNTFSGLNIYNSSNAASAAVGNVYLLALSTAFYKYAATKAAQFNTATDAELTLILNRLSRDLADDGDIDEVGFIAAFIRAVRSLSPAMIVDNLHSRSLVDYPHGLGVPDISAFLQLCVGDAECEWRAGAPTPTRAIQTASAALGGKVYYFGGAAPYTPTTPFASPPNAVFEYDVERNEWSPKAPMPIASRLSAAHAIGDRIYIVAAYGDGGFHNELLEYTPATDQWRVRAPKPTHRYGFVSAAVNGKIYVLGGVGTIDDAPWESGKLWTVKNYVEIYDPDTNSWSRGQDAPGAFGTSNQGCAVGNVIYVFGTFAALGVSADTSVLTYDTVLNSWSSTRPMNSARVDASCAVVDGAIYLAGGSNSGQQPAVSFAVSDVVERFEPLQQRWSTVTRLPTPRMQGAATAVGSEIVFLNGTNDTTSSAAPIDLVEILDTEAL